MSERKKDREREGCNSRESRIEIPDLFRDLSGDLIGPHGMFIRLLAESKVETSKHKRKRDPKPHAQQSQHGGERDLRQSHDNHMTSCDIT